jgi:hypothetical protein
MNTLDDPRYSPPLGLWCPYCHASFVGRVDRLTGRFVHGTCPVAELDTARLEALADESWFWARFRDRLFDVGGPDGPAALAS